MVDYLDRYVPRPVPQRTTQRIPRRPSAQLVSPSPRIVPALQQSAMFYVRETDRLDHPMSQPLPTPAVWQDAVINDGRQHRGYNSSRALQKSHEAPPSQVQLSASQQATQTRAVFDPMSIPEADGSWDDTVFISESSIIVPSRVAPRQQEAQLEPGVQLDPVARLAQLRRQQRGQHKI